jgi:quercetin dioxygenase-like cupin family protein
MLPVTQAIEGGCMTKKTMLGLAVVFFLALCERVASNAGAPWGNTPIPKSAADLKWVELDPTGAPGVKIANLWGDSAKGAFGAFFSLPPGFSAPLHTHTHPMKVVIVSGTYIQGPEGAPEFRLGPGSYLMQPGGNYRHTTSCDKASECVFFVESDGAFDLRVVAENAPAPK